MADLAELLERVKAGSAPDRQLFQDVARALLPDYQTGLVDWRYEFGGFLGAGAWTDAALALVERLLPGWSWTGGNIVRDDGMGGCWAVLYDLRGGHRAPVGGGMFATTPLAI